MYKLVVLLKSIVFLTFLFGLNACKLNYTPPANLYDLSMQRRAKLEKQLEKDYAGLNKKYSSLAYGEVVKVKPINYIKLDSLFEKKYQLTQQNLGTSEVDQAIEYQKAIIDKDSASITFLETHFFQLQEKQMYEFIIAQFALNKKNELTQMTQLDYFTADSIDAPMAQLYMKEESFTQQFDDPDPSYAEKKFYNLMKLKASSLIGQEKSDFLRHVFYVMWICNKSKRLNNTLILTKLTQNVLINKNPTIDFTTLSFDISNISTVESPTGTAYYEVLVRKNTEKAAFDLYKYNEFFQLIQ